MILVIFSDGLDMLARNKLGFCASGQPLQFAAPDTAHATGVTIAFIAGGDEGTTQMNQSLLDSELLDFADWWGLSDVDLFLGSENPMLA
jgi:hypothetical protein